MLFHSTSETAALLQNKPVIYPDTIFKLTPRYYENKRQGEFLLKFHQRIIDERRAILQENNNKSETCDANDSGYSIFIDHILNHPGMFSDEDIQHHVITVLSAGYFLECLDEFYLYSNPSEIYSLVYFGH